MKHKTGLHGKKGENPKLGGEDGEGGESGQESSGKRWAGGGGKYGLNTVYEILNDLIKILFL